MKELYNTALEFKNLDESKFNLIIDFLEDNNINYEQTDFEQFVVDERTEDEKYEDWLWEQADVINDERRTENE